MSITRRQFVQYVGLTGAAALLKEDEPHDSHAMHNGPSHLKITPLKNTLKLAGSKAVSQVYYISDKKTFADQSALQKGLVLDCMMAMSPLPEFTTGTNMSYEFQLKPIHNNGASSDGFRVEFAFDFPADLIHTMKLPMRVSVKTLNGDTVAQTSTSISLVDNGLKAGLSIGIGRHNNSWVLGLLAHEIFVGQETDDTAVLHSLDTILANGQIIDLQIPGSHQFLDGHEVTFESDVITKDRSNIHDVYFDVYRFDGVKAYPDVVNSDNGKKIVRMGPYDERALGIVHQQILGLGSDLDFTHFLPDEVVPTLEKYFTVTDVGDVVFDLGENGRPFAMTSAVIQDNLPLLTRDMLLNRRFADSAFADPDRMALARWILSTPDGDSVRTTFVGDQSFGHDTSGNKPLERGERAQVQSIGISGSGYQLDVANNTTKKHVMAATLNRGFTFEDLGDTIFVQQF